jgi:hypothetical protein
MQFAYQAGKSTVSALHHLVARIEVAFDNTGFDLIKVAAERRHIEPETMKWIIKMLEYRIVRSRLEI